MIVHTTQLWKCIINGSKRSTKVECLLWNNRKTLEEPCITVTQEVCERFDKKMNGKLSKNVWHST